MPDGPSDTAIDFYGSAFCREILDAAHPTRFSRERITYGSDIYTGFRSHVWPANTNDEIADGRRLAGTRRIPLAGLDEGSRPYGRLLHNILKPFGRRQWKDHFLTTYPDDRPVAFTMFDFDRHPPKGRKEPLSTESDEWMEIDWAFWEQVSAFHDLTTRLAVDVMWVQSPGSWLTDGHDMPCRMFGLYAVIRHSPHRPSELRVKLEALKERIGLEVETSWDIRHRNIRIPGQCFMDVCRVDPEMRSIVPIRDPDARTEREMNTARLAVALEEYGKLRPANPERLFSSAPGACPEKTGSTLPASSADANVTRARRGTGSARHGAPTSDNTDPGLWLKEPDTFRTLHASGLLRSALRQFGWDAARAEEAVRRMTPRFRRLRSASSRTCSDGAALSAFLKKHYLWGCRTCDQAKAKADARRKARAEDEARIAPSLRLDDKVLEAYLKGVVRLTGEETECVRRFRALERAHAGRVACRTLYAAFGGQRRFMAFQARHGILRIAEEHSQSRGLCRQWTLSPRAVRSVRMLMASPTLLFMVSGERRRGRGVIYIETHQRNLRRRRRISSVRPARGACHTHDSVTVTPAARGPPPEARKIGENGVSGTIGGAAGARRRGERAAAA